MQACLNAIVDATATADMPILEEIYRHAEHYAEAWPLDNHGITIWLVLLSNGQASLPDQLPRRVLEAWRDAYEPSFDLDGRPWCPRPFWLCQSCKMALPHLPGWSEHCPVCGSSEVWHTDFSKPLGVAWVNPHYRGDAA